MNASDSIECLAAALVATQAKIRNPQKDQSATIPTKAGGSFSFRFVSLAELLEQVRPVLAEHGISLHQELTSDQTGAVGVSTVLIHESGQWLRLGPLFIPAGTDPRDTGAAATTGRRYALMAALGITGDEEDSQAQPAQKPKAGPGKVTQPQLGKIAKLAEQVGVSADKLAAAALKDYGAATLGDLSKADASALIDRLDAKAKADAKAEGTAAASTQNVDPVTGEVSSSDDGPPPGMDGVEYRRSIGQAEDDEVLF